MQFHMTDKYRCKDSYYSPAPLAKKSSNGVIVRDTITTCHAAKYQPISNTLKLIEQKRDKYIYIYIYIYMEKKYLKM